MSAARPRAAETDGSARHPVAIALAIVLAGLAYALPPICHGAAPADSSWLTATPSATASVLPAPKLGGCFQAREMAEEQVGLTMALHRARLSIAGSLPSRFTYRALVEMRASAGARLPATVSLRKGIVKWNPTPLALTAGEFKTPFTCEPGMAPGTCVGTRARRTTSAGTCSRGFG